MAADCGANKEAELLLIVADFPASLLDWAEGVAGLPQAAMPRPPDVVTSS
jgi:hypothetical protein